MNNLFRFLSLRPAQKLTKEHQDTIGLRVLADGNISQWIQDLQPFFIENDHKEIHDRMVAFLTSSASISSYTQLSTILQDTIELLLKKGKKITGEDLHSVADPNALTAFFATSTTKPVSDYSKEKQAIEDTLVSLAFLGKLGNIKNIDLQRAYRATQILKKAHEKQGILNNGLLQELINKPLILPELRYSPCAKKFETIVPYQHLGLKPVADPELNPDGKPTQPTCNCDCGDPGCIKQEACCATMKPFIADLMLVREELTCYKPHHLAYIETIMQGEERVREHRSLERTESYSETETENNKSLEKDHQVEDRFSLKTEIEKTLEQDLSIETGVTVTAELGTVKLNTNFNFSYDLSKSESERQAQEYARNVVTRSVSKVEEKVRQLNSVRRISEVEEKNTHTFKNVPGTKHINGQYHFVNMINKAQVMNYGKRLMMEFTLPEPMQLYKKLLEKDVLPFGLVKPVKPPLRIDQIHYGKVVEIKIDEDTIEYHPTDTYSENTDVAQTPHYLENGVYYYQDLQTYYGLTGIEILPDPDICIPFSFESPTIAEGPNQVVAFPKSLGNIPVNYNARAIKIDIKGFDYIGDFDNPNPADPTFLDLEFFVNGQSSGTLSGSVHKSSHWYDIDHNGFDATQNSTLTMSVMARSCVGFAGSGFIKCLLSEQAKMAWRTKIWEKIMAKYNQDLQNYETARARYEQEKKAKLPFGNNPFINREIERTELKRMAISYISCQFYDQFNAMKRNVEPCGYPEMNLAEAESEGMFIRFFEQLFEWNLMTYLFYPYFWGQKCSWAEKIQTNSGDPLFDKALMAGSARVQLPVRPGMEALAMHWVTDGEIWQGASEPPVANDPYYLSMAQEIKEQKNCFYRDREGELEVKPGVDFVSLTDTDFYWDALTIPTGGTEPGMVNLANVEADLNRELIINCEVYRIVNITEGSYPDLDIVANPTPEIDTVNHQKWTIWLDRKFEGKGCCGCDEPNPAETIKHVLYHTGALFVGAPFQVVVPTNLVLLRNKLVDGVNVSADCLPCYPLDKCE